MKTAKVIGLLLIGAVLGVVALREYVKWGFDEAEEKNAFTQCLEEAWRREGVIR